MHMRQPTCSDITNVVRTLPLQTKSVGIPSRVGDYQLWPSRRQENSCVTQLPSVPSWAFHRGSGPRQMIGSVVVYLVSLLNQTGIRLGTVYVADVELGLNLRLVPDLATNERHIL